MFSIASVADGSRLSSAIKRSVASRAISSVACFAVVSAGHDCFEKGLLIRTTGDTIALSPPLIVTAAQIEEIVTVLGNSLRKVA